MSGVSSVRSYLYVPGDRPDWMSKASASGADALILDLEDAVAESSKDAAVASVVSFLGNPIPRTQSWIRIDGSRPDDIEHIVHPNLTGVVVPGAEPALLRVVAERLGTSEREAGLPPGRILLIALVETAAALQSLPELAAAPRLLRLGIGEADLAAELWMQPSADRREMAAIRSSIVVASSAAGLAPPVGPVETVVDDLALLERTTLTQRRQGFRARTAIHPRQIQAINAVFTPSTSEVEYAGTIVEAFDEALGAGKGAVRGPRGELVDAATVRSAREVLGRAARAT